MIAVWNSHIVLFAFLEDIVLSHANCLHYQLDSLQLDIAILCQVALQTNTSWVIQSTGQSEILLRKIIRDWKGGVVQVCVYTHSSFVHNVFVDVDQSIYCSLSVQNNTSE